MITLQITEALVVRTGLGGSMIGVITLGVASAHELTTAISGIRNGDSGIPLGMIAATHQPAGGHRRRRAHLHLLGAGRSGALGPALGNADRLAAVGNPVVQ